MKTLTAKLAVAALLVCSAAVQAEATLPGLISSVIVPVNLYNAGQSFIATWNAAQASKKSGIKSKTVSTVGNYAYPVVKAGLTLALAARAHGHVTVTSANEYVKACTSSDVALYSLVGLTVLDKLYNTRTPAQVAADAATVAALETGAQSLEASIQAATASTTAATTTTAARK